MIIEHVRLGLPKAVGRNIRAPFFDVHFSTAAIFFLRKKVSTLQQIQEGQQISDAAVIKKPFNDSLKLINPYFNPNSLFPIICWLP
jgi:hypothetical protein